MGCYSRGAKVDVTHWLLLASHGLSSLSNLRIRSPEEIPISEWRSPLPGAVMALIVDTSAVTCQYYEADRPFRRIHRVSSVKTPFRYQTSEYDCVPTTLLNGLSFLFDRDEIPAQVIQRIYLYCLDIPGDNGQAGQGGTSLSAIRLIVEWLNKYKCEYEDKRCGYFSVCAELVERNGVHFRKDGKILKCLKEGGVAALSVTQADGDTHYILALKLRDGWLQCFDPYQVCEYGEPPKSKNEATYRFIKRSTPTGQNLCIKRDWLHGISTRKAFQLGIKSRRQCLLLRKRNG